MARRIYDPKKTKRKSLEAAALSRLRETRARIDPALLKRARQMIRAMEAAGAGMGVGAIGQDVQAQGIDPALKIDREKNLATVMKFMEMKKGDPVFKAKLQEFLAGFH